MFQEINRYHLGQVVQVIRGRESGTFAIIVGLETDRYLWLADGKRRKAMAPKRKNIRHVQPTKHVATEVAKRLTSNGQIDDAHLRYALNQFLQGSKGE
ncbi:hypothetical protein SAMN05444392_107200 [Seinonella peptonophila]|uniref:Ribosomal protein L14E/L6E/L27E n=1 Tax=Seinonella peptonophila TaxID=112248 RepID=A0A1M4YXQ4_9BACL|nr:KOW domain-containing RNA-binding protein [Seinonella peptonophila]SHF10292.1 hypothetical protein SAMN05444392_107200 [Seinonella peptonophila]